MLTSSLWLRQLLAALAATSGYHKLPERETAWPHHFDNTDGIGPVARQLFYRDKGTGIYLPFKGMSAPVPVEQKIGIEAHITAIAFGTTRAARAFWSRLIEAGEIPDEIWQLYGDDVASAAQRMALHQRFWKVPYHWVALLNGDVLHNNDITRYTFHGNGGNHLLIGVSLEGNFPGLEASRTKKHHGYDEHTILTGRAALELGTLHSRELGAPVEWLYAHRQYTDGRLGDPGEGWWREIGLPTCSKVHLKRNVTFSHGTGNQIPREWDPDGLVDFRGRPIRS